MKGFIGLSRKYLFYVSVFINNVSIYMKNSSTQYHTDYLLVGRNEQTHAIDFIEMEIFTQFQSLWFKHVNIVKFKKKNHRKVTLIIASKNNAPVISLVKHERNQIKTDI